MITSESYRVGDLTLDVTARLLIRDGELLTLPPKTFELLVALVRKAPGVVSRRELMDSVWVDEIVNDEALVASLKVEPGVDPLRTDPRFNELIRRLAIPG